MKAVPHAVFREINKRKLIYVVVALFIISVMIDRSYLNRFNLQGLTTDVVIIGFLALGQMLCIISGGIDLSVGCMASASSVLTAYMMIQLQNAGFPPWLNLIGSVLFALGFCTALGIINGLSIAVLKLPPLIATLGGMWIARGFGFYFLNGMATSFRVKEFTNLTRIRVGFIPLAFFLFLAIVVLVFYILTRRRSGRAVYAMGGNPYSAQLSGISNKKVIISVYACSALLAAISGLVLGSFTGAGYVKGADGFELYSIAAVAIGGVSMAGGSGDTFNAMLGVVVFRMISKLLVFAGLSSLLEGLYLGLLMIVALLLSTGTFTPAVSWARRRLTRTGNKPRAEGGPADE